MKYGLLFGLLLIVSSLSGQIELLPPSSSPSFEAVPTISGTVSSGSTLSVNIGTAASFSPVYQWYRDDVAIVGATSNQYTVTNADKGSQLSCLVSITQNGRTASAWSTKVEYYVDYYVSEVDGNASNSGSISDPITAAKLLTLTLTNRTRLYFKAGETYQIGDLHLPYKSSLSKYGAGANPIFIGSTDIATASWTNEGSNTWSTVIAPPNWVFVDGATAKRAVSDWLAVSSLPATNKIRVSGATKTTVDGFSNIVGAKLRMYLYGWILSNEYTVTAYDSGTGDITLDQVHSAGQTLWFYLYDQQQFFNDLGEWHYNSSEGKLYYKSTVSPSTLDIRATYYDHGLIVDGNEVSLESFTLQQYYHSGVFNVKGLYLTAQDFAITDVHNAGFYSPLPSTVTNFEIQRCGNQGITVADSKISDFTINAIGVSANWPMPSTAVFGNMFMGNGVIYTTTFKWSPLFTYSKYVSCYYNGKWWISLTAANLNNVPSEGANWTSLGDYNPTLIPTNEISYGTVSNTARCGIYSSSCFNLEIYNNVFHDFLKRTRDGGAIYFISNLPNRALRLTTSYGHVHHNIIYNGTKTTEQSLITAATVDGIYLDNYSAYFTVENNTVINSRTYKIDYGIFHYVPTRSNTVRNNNVVGCIQQASIWEHRAYSGFPNEAGFQAYFPENIANIYTGNIFVCKSSAQRCVYTRSIDNLTTYNPFASGGNSDQNHYVNPYGVNINSHEASATVDYDLPGWRTKNGMDALSTVRTNFLTYTDEATADTEVKVEYNATDEAVNFSIPGGYTDVYGNAPSNPYTIQPYESILYLKAP